MGPIHKYLKTLLIDCGFDTIGSFRMVHSDFQEKVCEEIQNKVRRFYFLIWNYFLLLLILKLRLMKTMKLMKIFLMSTMNA